MFLEHTNVISNLLKNELADVRNLAISSRTVGTRSHKAGFSFRRLAHKPLVARGHNVQIVNIARLHQELIIND